MTRDDATARNQTGAPSQDETGECHGEAQRLAALAEVSRAVAESTDRYDELVHRVAGTVGGALGATCVVRFSHPDGTLTAGSGWYPRGGALGDELAELASSVGSGPNTGVLMRLPRARYVDGVENVAGLIPSAYGPLLPRLGVTGATFLGLRARDRIVGLMVIGLNDFATKEQTELIRDAEFCELVGQQVALAADNAALLETARRELLERRRADAALSASEERFRSAFRESPAGMLLLDRARCVSEMNAAAVRLLGRPGDAIVGTPFVDLLAPSSVEAIERSFAELATGARFSAELELDYRSEGPDRPRSALTAVSRAAERERSYAYVVHAVDITAQRHAAAEIHVLNNLLLQQLEELTDARSALSRALAEVAELRELDRRELSTTLHENTLQTLVAAEWAFDDLRSRLGDSEDLLHLGTLVDEAIASLRTISRSLLPPTLSTAGLGPALDQLVRAFSEAGAPGALTCELQAEAITRFEPSREAIAYRVAAEALDAALARHGSRCAVVRVAIEQATLRLEVRLDGGLHEEVRRGLDVESVRLSMSEMIGRLGGELAYEPDVVTLVLPTKIHDAGGRRAPVRREPPAPGVGGDAPAPS